MNSMVIQQQAFIKTAVSHIEIVGYIHKGDNINVKMAVKMAKKITKEWMSLKFKDGSFTPKIRAIMEVDKTNLIQTENFTEMNADGMLKNPAYVLAPVGYLSP